MVIIIYKGVITMDIFTSFISGPIFIALLLIYSLCVTIYFILKKNETSSNNVEGAFAIKAPTTLLSASFFICFLALTTFFLSKNLLSFIYFLLPVIFLLVLIGKRSKLILRKESMQADKLRCSYKSIQHINFESNPNPEKCNLNITINNKTHILMIQAKDKDKIKEILDSKIIVNN